MEIAYKIETTTGIRFKIIKKPKLDKNYLVVTKGKILYVNYFKGVIETGFYCAEEKRGIKKEDIDNFYEIELF